MVDLEKSVETIKNNVQKLTNGKMVVTLHVIGCISGV